MRTTPMLSKDNHLLKGRVPMTDFKEHVKSFPLVSNEDVDIIKDDDTNHLTVTNIFTAEVTPSGKSLLMQTYWDEDDVYLDEDRHIILTKKELGKLIYYLNDLYEEMHDGARKQS